MKPWVVMRCRNDIRLVEATLQGLREQTLAHNLLVIDNASSDGSRALVERYADRVIDIPEGQYIPGRILNLAMRECDSPLVAFVNSDCTPDNADWLSQLLLPFDNPGVAASYGRQMPRSDCYPIFARDTLAMYPDGPAPAWRVAFSMASSAVRRTAWEQIPFNESVTYSEDIEWSGRLRAAGHLVQYAPQSRVFHSHNYSVSQWIRRMRGEGSADAVMFPNESFLRYTLLPLFPQILRDCRYCLRQRQWRWLALAPLYRLAGAWGRHRGYRGQA